MARQARLVETDVAFHITARGNYRQTVFFSDQDRAEYLELLGRHATLEELEIFGWCLMTNHTHLLAVPRQRAALARTMRRTQADYSQRLNRRIGSRVVISGSPASTRARSPATPSGRFSATSN